MPVNKGYSPLEAYEHGSKLTPKADIYSIAAVFYSIITAERPLSSKRRSQVDTLVPPSKRGIKIDRSFENALLNALNIKAENRTESLRIFNEELCSEKTKRKWERVKAPQKRDLTFVKEGFFWRKVAAYAMVIVMAASLIGIIIETSIVKNKEQQEYENRPEVTSIEAATVSETENTDF